MSSPASLTFPVRALLYIGNEATTRTRSRLYPSHVVGRVSSRAYTVLPHVLVGGHGLWERRMQALGPSTCERCVTKAAVRTLYPARIASGRGVMRDPKPRTLLGPAAISLPGSLHLVSGIFCLLC